MLINPRVLFVRSFTVALLVLALLPFYGLMGFAHPAIDDYDNAATVARLGRWGAQWYWYTHWSGRFVAIGFSTAFNPLSYGPRSGAAPTGLWALRAMLLLLGGGLVLATQQLFRSLLLILSGPAPAPSRGRTWVLALAVITLGMNAIPEPFTLLYWYSGAVNYVLPLVLMLGFVTAALQALRRLYKAVNRRGWAVLATLGLVGAVGGGEITMLCCGVLLVVMGAWLWGSVPPPGAWQLWALWVGVAVITAGLLVGAPGNWQRFAMADPDPGPWYHRWVLLVPRTVLTAARMAARPPVLASLLVLVVSVLLPATGPRRPRPELRELGLIMGGYVLFNIVGVAFLKAAFMRDLWVEAMPGRVVNVLVLQLLISTAAIMLWVRGWVPVGPDWLRRRVFAPALVGLTLVLLFTGQTRLAWQELLYMAPSYSRQMQARYEVLDAAHRLNRAEAVLSPLRLPYATGLLAPIPSARQRADVHIELHTDATQKNNIFLANYYGIQRVRLSEPAPLPQP